MITFPNAKINLGLSITKRRPDGFHELETGMYPVPFHDLLEMVPSDRGTSLVTSGLTISGDPKSNLIYRAWEILRDRHRIPDVQIHVHKMINLGAGLGGGSSNAASALILLNVLFRLGLSDTILKEYAGMLGSDCPFFISNEPALATGKGTQLNPLSLDLSGVALLLVFPGIHIDTKEAYGWISPNIKTRPLHELILKDPLQWKNNLKNDFEPAVFRRFPRLVEIKKTLYQNGAFYASMSGSGSTLFGLFDNARTLPGQEVFPDCKVWKGFL